MIRFVRAIAALLTATFLAACTNTITAEVIRSHNLPTPAGETIQVVTSDEARGESLESHLYAEMVGEQLGRLGYRPPVEGEASKLIARLEYGSDEGRAAYSGYSPDNYFDDNTHDGYSQDERSHHIYGKLYSGGADESDYSHYGYGYGNSRGVYYKAYNRRLTLDIVDRESGEVLFEGVVDNLGRERSPDEVMPYLIEAMFTDFPGEPGQTTKVTIDIPKTDSSSAE